MKKLFLIIILGLSISLSAQDMKYCPKMSYPVYYKGFVVDWDTNNRIPKLVYYTVIYDSLKSYGRTYFGTDESIINPSYSWEYDYTGYDRGHMMPSASAQSYKMWEDCYWMTNIAPQNPDLNRKLWKSIEFFERNNSDPKVYIITGSYGHCGWLDECIEIPCKFYKIIYNEYWDSMIAFLCSQEDGYESIEDVVTTVDEIEKLTGIDFFKSMNKNDQECLESYYDLNDWW